MTKPLEYSDAVGEAARSYMDECRAVSLAPSWRELFNRMVAAARPKPEPVKRCLIDGCERDPHTNRICTWHWNRLPLKVRQRWWEETENSGPPSGALIAEVREAFKQGL